MNLCIRSHTNDDSRLEAVIVTISYCQNTFALVWFTLIDKFILGVLFLAAMISSSLAFLKIINALRKREDSDLQSNQDQNKNHIRKQVAIILIANGMIFFICQIPLRVFDISQLLSFIILKDHQKAKLVIITRIFDYINSAINPFIYSLGSKYYREAFKESFRLRRTS